MKYLFLSISIICSINCIAQDPNPDLFQTWHLTSVMIDDLAPLYIVSEIDPPIQPYVTIEGNLSFSGQGACNTFDVMDQLNKINAPVLVLTASDDQLTPIKYGQFLAEHIKNATLSNIEDAGHLSPVERPEEVARTIHDFIATI